MAEKNEIMNIMDYEVVDTRSNDIQTTPYIFILPWIIGFLVFTIGPLMQHHFRDIMKWR